jgi:hypothetical protein
VGQSADWSFDGGDQADAVSVLLACRLQSTMRLISTTKK